jgi:hypothetical protein
MYECIIIVIIIARFNYFILSLLIVCIKLHIISKLIKTYYYIYIRIYNNCKLKLKIKK